MISSSPGRLVLGSLPAVRKLEVREEVALHGCAFAPSPSSPPAHMIYNIIGAP